MPRSRLDEFRARQANAELSRRLRSIQGLVAVIKGQMRLFEMTSRDNPAGHSSILMEIAQRVDQLKAEAAYAENSLPANAPENLKANVRGTSRRIAKELQKVYESLRNAFASIDEAFKDPSRAQTPFGDDPISMIVQWADLLSTVIKRARRASR